MEIRKEVSDRLKVYRTFAIWDGVCYTVSLLMGKWPKNSEELKYFVLNSFGFHFLCAHKRECENVQDSSVIKCTNIASILVKVWQSNLPFQQTICTVELATDMSQRWSLGLGCNFSFRKDFVSLDFFHCKKKL